jgi:hypothetical protein
MFKIQTRDEPHNLFCTSTFAIHKLQYLRRTKQSLSESLYFITDFSESEPQRQFFFQLPMTGTGGEIAIVVHLPSATAICVGAAGLTQRSRIKLSLL